MVMIKIGDQIRGKLQGSPGETPPCTLIAPGACKIRRGCNFFQVSTKFHLWRYQSEGVILSVADQYCDGKPPGHP